MESHVVGSQSRRYEEIISLLQGMVNTFITFVTILNIYDRKKKFAGVPLDGVHGAGRRYSLRERVPRQLQHIHRVVGISDEECINQLRMSRRVFTQLCYLLENGAGLRGSRNSSVAEKVAMFLSILAHHTKLRIVKAHYKRSTRTVSKNFHQVLNAIIKLHSTILVKPVPIDETCTNERWSCFQGCLGALDGTYVDVTVAKVDRARYRNRKGHVSVNILAVCDVDMNYVYVLSGWEGSAADARVLRDAVGRPNGLRIPRGDVNPFYVCRTYGH